MIPQMTPCAKSHRAVDPRMNQRDGWILVRDVQEDVHHFEILLVD